MEPLKHECGVAMIRLLKPLDYYEKKYGTWTYGFNKLYLLMEKQHNRGQEGAGFVTVNLRSEPGMEYMFRERAEGKDAITDIFSRVDRSMVGELYMGHLRYSTTGKSGLKFVHPFLRRNNWRARNLSLCGNFNMTNIDEVFSFLAGQGQSPRIYGDGYLALELMGHRLDREVERRFREAKAMGLTSLDITRYIDGNISMVRVLQETMSCFDGGYVMCGMTGSGEMFAIRDPWGIRPAFYYQDEEVMVLASERPVIQTVFNVPGDAVLELPPGRAIIVSRNGHVGIHTVLEPRENSRCSFERIYFSRGSDQDIYCERKRLGEQLAAPVLNALGGDLSHAVLSYIPNTAEVAFYGMTGYFRRMHLDIRTEKVVWKDIKLRTFIAQQAERNDMAAHVYDVTYGSVIPYVDTLVIIDDSIVRGTTLKESILKILDRLHPKKIIMVSSSPQVRYPDYYGIDMSSLEELCAYRAAMALLLERDMLPLISDIRRSCLTHPEVNAVRRIYEPFSVEEINRKMAEMLRPAGMETPVELVFQSVEGLHEACPGHPGDWYFTGRYPTPGGIRLVNRAFVDYIEKELHIH